MSYITRKNSILLFLICLCTPNNIHTSAETPSLQDCATTLTYHSPATITADDVDTLVQKGIQNILDNGEDFKARAGNGRQDYEVSYTLTNPMNRLHLIRQPISIRYFCRELLAYFKGSLKVDEGLAQAASFWKTLANERGEIASNYGHYIFYQKVPGTDTTQYEWVIQELVKNIDSKKAIININQPSHKDPESKDFPCTRAMHFFVHNNALSCIVSSRSTDVYTGLPYDMGFFALVTELVYKDLKERLPEQKSKDLTLGFVTMKTNFTQIYDKTKAQALRLLPKDTADLSNLPQKSATSSALASLDSSASSSPSLTHRNLNTQTESTCATPSASTKNSPYTEPRSVPSRTPTAGESANNTSFDFSAASSSSTSPCRRPIGSSTPRQSLTPDTMKLDTLNLNEILPPSAYTSPSTKNKVLLRRSTSLPFIEDEPMWPLPENKLSMPPIKDAQMFLQDIYKQTAKTPLMQWIYIHAELPIPQ